MPMPVNGINQHYGDSPDEYFGNHNTDQKRSAGLSLVRRAEQLLGRRGELLDIGTGRGEVLEAAIQQGWSAIGIEPSDTFAEHASRRSGAEVRRVPIENCDFARESFDVVILAAVLEHLYYPDETLHAISQALRPGGLLFLDVPNELGLYFRIGNLYYKLNGRDWVVNLAPTFSPFHVFGFSGKALRKILGKHSFEIIDQRFYGGTSLVPASGGAGKWIESVAAKGVSFCSRWGESGNYIEAWAQKK